MRIGIGSALAVNGAVAHACTDVIFKGLLFMSMGAVLHVTGRIKGSELGGLYKTMPITTVLCLAGAASISAFPLFSGFASKSMVMSAALQEGYDGPLDTRSRISPWHRWKRGYATVSDPCP